MLIWGVYVYVGICLVYKVMLIMMLLFNYYLYLLVFLVLLFWWGGEDIGYVSNWVMMFQQLFIVGLLFYFQRWVEFEGFVYDQKKIGIIDYMDEICWDIRFLFYLGILEVWICDGVFNL